MRFYKPFKTQNYATRQKTAFHLDGARVYRVK